MSLPAGQAFLNGFDLSKLDTETIQKTVVGLAQASFFIASETLKNNIDPIGNIDHERIKGCLECISDSNTALQIASRLDAKWSDCEFSSGWQRQIAIARMLLRLEGEVFVMEVGCL